MVLSTNKELCSLMTLEAIFQEKCQIEDEYPNTTKYKPSKLD